MAGNTQPLRWTMRIRVALHLNQALEYYCKIATPESELYTMISMPTEFLFEQVV